MSTDSGIEFIAGGHMVGEMGVGGIMGCTGGGGAGIG